MSATSSVLLKLLIIASSNLLLVCCGSALSIHNNNGLVSDWQRNLEAQLSRVLVRLDQLELRVGRVQSLIQLRFDNIESGYTTTKLRMDVLGDGLSRIDEQLSRKWKILESKFDILLINVDSKLDTRLNAMQRDNRRHNEFLTQSFTSVVVTQEKLNDKVAAFTKQVNSSIQEVQKGVGNHSTSNAQLVQNSDKMLNILLQLVSNASNSSSQCQVASSNPVPTSVSGSGTLAKATFTSQELHNQTLAQQLLGNKVTNMFEDLMRRSTSMETVLKDAVSLANMTRKDVHDGFRTLIASSMANAVGSSQNNNQHRSSSRSYNTHSTNWGGNGNSGGSNGGSSSSELMSAVIVEALASVDSMSNALGRKITELSRSMDERLELVSMSINGSCTRIQSRQPMLEDKIADLLIDILNTVDNSTALWFSVADHILEDRENITKQLTGMGTCRSHDHDQMGISHQPQSKSRNSNNGANNQGFPLETGSQRSSSTLQRRPTFQQRYGDEEIFDHVEPPEIESGEQEPTATMFPSTDVNFNRNTNKQSRRPKAQLSPTTTTPSSRTRADGEILSEEDKKSLWESLTEHELPTST